MDLPDWNVPADARGPGWAWRRLLLRPLLTGAMKAGAAVLLDLEWEGERAIPRTGPCIVASNHASRLDPPLLSIAVHEATRRQPVCLSWEGNLQGWTGPLLRLYGAVTIGEGKARRSDLKRIIEQLDDGRVLAIWPEGGISPDGRLKPFLPGLAWILRRRPCPVVPATILGTRQAWPPDRSWFRPGKVEVRFHPAILPSPGDLLTRQSRARLTERVRRSIAAALPGGRADLPPGAARADWPL